MMRPRATRTILAPLVLLAAVGCKKKPSPPPPPPPPTRPVEPPATATRPTPATSKPTPATSRPAPATSTKPAEDPFDTELARVAALEENLEFSEALLLAREVQVKFADHPRAGELKDTLYRILQSRRESYRIATYLEKLDGESGPAVDMAKQQLLDARDLGKAYLRKAVRARSIRAAARATEAFLQVMDYDALPVLIGRIVKEKENRSPDLLTIVRAVEEMIARLKPAEAAALLAFVRQDRERIRSRLQSRRNGMGALSRPDGDLEFGRRHAARLLAGYFDKVCRRDPATFNEAVGDPDGYVTLRDYVELAVVSERQDLIAWACTYGATVAGEAASLKGRYYADNQFTKLAGERLDRQVLFADASSFRFPGGRTEWFSIHWIGEVEIARPGTYTFYALADDAISISLDGKPILSGTYTSEGSAAVQLQPGLHPIEVRFRQDGGEGKAYLRWSGPNIAKTAALPFRIGPTPQAVLAAAEATGKLGSAKADELRQARAHLEAAGDIGLMYLRHAVNHKPDPIARQAMDLLAGLGDRRAVPVLLERLKKDNAKAVTMSLMHAGRRLAKLFTRQELAWCWEQFKADTKCEMVAPVAVLCGAFEAAGTAAKFNELLGDGQAAAVLAAYLDKAMASADGEAVARACEFGRPFSPLMLGLRGRYCRGQQFDDVAGVQQDTTLYTDPGQLTCPGERKEDFTVAWDGFVEIDKKAEYKFYLSADDGVVMHLDGRYLLSGWSNETDKSIALDAGLHQLQLRLRQTTGTAWCRLLWSGPGFSRAKIDGGALRTVPWDEHLQGLAKAVRDLGSDDAAKLAAARRLLKDGGGVGLVYLRNAARYESGPVLAQAMRLLAEAQDAAVTEILIARIQQQPDLRVDEAVLHGLTALAARIDPKHFPALYGVVKADAATQMPCEAAALCAAAVELCAGDKAAFGKLVKDPAGYDTLKQYVARHLASEDLAVVARALEYGGPFAPLATGLRARYYEGTDFDKLVREELDGPARFENRGEILPGGRKENVTIEWTGFVAIDAPGEYVFKLRADDYAAIWVDGKHVVTSVNRYHDFEGRTALDKGLHPFRMVYRQVGAEFWLYADWRMSGGQFAAIPVESFRCPVWATETRRLPETIKKLTSSAEDELAAARERLKRLGEAGCIGMRRAVKDAPEELLAEIVRLMIEVDDGGAPAAMLGRLRADPNVALSRAIATGLSRLARHIDPKEVPAVYEAVRKDAGSRMTARVAALCGVLDQQCRGAADALNKLAGDPKAHEVLAACVDRALASADAATVARACEFGYPLAGLANGLRGRYYEGTDFDKLILERLDWAPLIERNQFPHPAKRQNNVSAEWTGWIRIDQPGNYEFSLWGRDWAALWIDGRFVVASSGEQEAKGAIALTQGMHPLRAVVKHTISGARIMLQWQPPGSGRSYLPNSVLFTAPWPAELGKLPAVIQRLADDEEKTADAARAHLERCDFAGRAYLRHALRDAAGKVLDQAVRMLVDADDSRTPAALLARLKADPKAAEVPAVVEGLAALAHHVDPAELPSLYKAVAADAACRMGPPAAVLCAVLETVCRRDSKAFGGLGNDPKAAETLQAYVAKALTSADAEVVARACEFGPPFVPYLPGLRTRFFDGLHQAVPAGQSVATSLYVDGRGRPFPHPKGRRETVSATWTGLLRIDKPGKYFFYLTGDDAADLWIDRKLVVRSYARQEAGGAAELAAGLHPIRIEMRQGGGEVTMALRWGTDGRNKAEVPVEVLATPAWRDDLLAVPKAIDLLTSKDAAKLDAARETIRRLDPLSRHFLRNALRDTKDPALIEPLVTALLDRRDEELAPLLLGRLRRDPKLARSAVILDALRLTADRIPAEHGGWLRQLRRADAKVDPKRHAAVLAAMLELACAADKDKYNALVADPGGYDDLKETVEKALTSKDAADVAWACEFGGPFAPLVGKLRGRYYKDRFFRQLAEQREDSHISFPNRQFYHHQWQQDNVSGRWSGYLRVAKPGKYTFRCRADDGITIWIDGKPVIDTWVDLVGVTTSVQVELDEGLHPFEAALWQGTGNVEASLEWAPPGQNKFAHVKDVFASHPWAQHVQAMEKTIQDLAAKDGNLRNATRERLKKTAGDIGLIYLRNAVRHQPEELAQEAGKVLESLKDEEGLRLLAERFPPEEKPPDKGKKKRK